MLMTSSHVKEVVCAESVKQLVVMKEEEEDNEVVIIVLLPRRREPYLYIHVLYL